MPAGWVFGHKGSAIFKEDLDLDELFLLGYLNSSLATYFMKRIVNTTATADVGYVEKLPFRKPRQTSGTEVVDRVSQIIDRLKADADANISKLRAEIDDRIFDLFEIKASRRIVLDYYDAVGRVEASSVDEADPEELVPDPQAAIE